jgi:histidine triad (HIT) family protein
MADCIFCRIRDQEVPKDFIMESDQVMVFNDINPKAPVHVLLVSKEHIQSAMHLTPSHKELLYNMFNMAKETAAKKGLSGYKLIFNVGIDGGMLINHLHLHLLGGWPKGEPKKVEV